jgi:hypothetical protein
MDFLHRNANNQPQTVRSNGAGQPSGVTSNADRVKKIVGGGEPGWLRAATVVLLFSLTILAIGVTSLFYFGREREAHYVDETKVQAVFLTNGQVYFGAITDINTEFIDLQDIYYLNSQQADSTTEQAQQPTNFSLVKLGCELHGPTDQMLINRDQVSFWENLTDDGKVTKAIAEWRTQNPDGQKCDNTTGSTQQSTGNTQGATDTSTDDTETTN